MIYELGTKTLNQGSACRVEQRCLICTWLLKFESDVLIPYIICQHQEKSRLCEDVEQ